MKTKEDSTRFTQVKEALNDPRFIMTLGFVIADLDLYAKMMLQIDATQGLKGLTEGLDAVIKERIENPNQPLNLHGLPDAMNLGSVRNYLNADVYRQIGESLNSLDFNTATPNQITDVLIAGKKLSAEGYSKHSEELNFDIGFFLAILILTIFMRSQAFSERKKGKRKVVEVLKNDLKTPKEDENPEEEIPPWVRDDIQDTSLT